MKMQMASDWPAEQLQGNTTSKTFRDGVTGEWSSARGALHDTIISGLLAGKEEKKNPQLWVVTGGVGSGKSTLIRTELAPEQPDAVVIDADQLWLKIPEYEALAAADWKTAGDRTYAEVRYLRDALLVEAAARRLNIILEISGDEDSSEAINLLEQDGYELSVNYVHCPLEEAQERIRERANTKPTPEDNLWCSPRNPDFPDKYDYQNIDLATFQRQYQTRKAGRQRA